MSVISFGQEPVDLLEAFFACVRDCRRVPAVETANGVHSYEELESLAFQLAATIHHLTENPCPRVLVALPPSQQAYAAMLGSLIAGGTFCPLDLTAPEAQNAMICEDFAPEVVLYASTPPGFLSNLPTPTPRADVLKPLAKRSGGPVATGSDVAYVVFTSGSTGRPKGVKISRPSLSHFLGVCQNYFKLSPGEKWGQWSSLAHDLGVMDVFMALTQSGTLVPVSGAQRLRPATAVREKCISVWQSVPSVLDLMMGAGQLTNDYLASLRVMSFCGEPLRRQQLEALFNACPDLEVFNTYGTTETVGFNTLNHLTSENFMDSCELESAAIGDEIPGWSIGLRGDNRDDEGEIVVTSNFLSGGYWRDDEGTRAAFETIKVDGLFTLRCYSTGDWGVRRHGRLYCSGRIDRQIKIHGERIELGEIDFRLRQLGFPDAYTVFSGAELHAFVESTEPLDQEQIRASLRSSLPVHAIPQEIHALPRLPRNLSRKIDRQALLKEIGS